MSGEEQVCVWGQGALDRFLPSPRVCVWWGSALVPTRARCVGVGQLAILKLPTG